MFTLTEGLKIFIDLEPLDLRKSIDGLSSQVMDVLSVSPQSGHLFVFFNKSRDKLKVLLWHRNGFLLLYKKLEKGKFKVPKPNEQGVIEITENQFNWLLAGLDFMLMKAFSEINYSNFY